MGSIESYGRDVIKLARTANPAISYNCGKVGHISKNCFKKKTGDSRSMISRSISVMVDTGSDNSFVSRGFVNDSQLKTHKAKKLVAGFSGEVTEINEAIKLKDTNLFVHDKEHEDII